MLQWDTVQVRGGAGAVDAGQLQEGGRLWPVGVGEMC